LETVVSKVCKKQFEFTGKYWISCHKSLQTIIRVHRKIRDHWSPWRTKHHSSSEGHNGPVVTKACKQSFEFT